MVSSEEKVYFDSETIKDRLQQARQNVSKLLGEVQDLEEPGLDIEIVTKELAEATRNLYQANNFLDSQISIVPDFLNFAMDKLRTVLQKLQDLETHKELTEQAIKTIASSLSLLYPITKSLERLRETGSIELVKKKEEVREEKKKEEEEEPIPLGRRAAPRVDLEVDIGMDTENNFYTGLSENISEGGIFVATHFPLPIGTEVNLNFTLPDGHIVQAKGRVKWIREYNVLNEEQTPGMGIQFIELSEEDKKAIEQFIKKRAPLFYEEF